MNRFNLWSALAIFAWLIVLIYTTTIYAKSGEVAEQETAVVYIEPEENQIYDQPAQEPKTYADLFRENANVIENCKITHYCVEQYEHICGTGDGITSTGVPVTAGWTCAVDPDVIPYGCEVMVDYGDRVEFWKAQDCGGSVKGNHIDLAVETHAEALEKGVENAIVYFMEVNYGFG